MTETEMKDYLSRYRESEARIRDTLEEIQRIESGLYPGSSALDPSGIRSGRIADKTAEMAIRLTSAQDRLISEKVNGFRIRCRIEDLIDRIEDPDAARLLFDRYICFLPWEQIAEGLRKNPTFIRGRKHSEALRAAMAVYEAQ